LLAKIDHHAHASAATYARECADDAHLGQTAGRYSHHPTRPAAESLDATLAEIVPASAGFKCSDEADLTIVHLNQTDATTGAASIRQLAAQRDPD